ncbi:MAG: galactokinase family protein [Bacillota bacterium]|nr:galactokinase family protein [Bacillota bacterium]
MHTTVLKKQFEDKLHTKLLLDLYEDDALLTYQTRRYIAAIDKFEELYGAQEVEIYSAAGRSEVSGNHTDHQHGCVLAASINLDAIGVVAPQENVIKVVSDHFNIKEIDINYLEKRDDEIGTSEGLIRGVVYKLKELGYKVGGFKAFITSDVLMGAGLSSSAAFETMIGTIIDGLYNNMEIDMVTIAKVGQFAENVYFGKPCGLMDQCACAVGGLISIDFKDTSKPIVTPVNVDFSKFNHSLCIVDTKGSHADLTDEYAAVPAECKKVAAYFGKEVLREVPVEEFYANIAKARVACGDRAVLRAIHFFNENERVGKIVNALNNDDFDTFKANIQASGNSSYKFLQNVYAASDPQNQAVSIGLAMSEILLKDKGVCRVHGGGFAGTIQAFVEDDAVEAYKEGMEAVFGLGTCHVLKVRKYGGCKVVG